MKTPETELEACILSIVHWERMYENMWWLWDTYHKKNIFDYGLLCCEDFQHLTGETWTAEYCALCSHNYYYCKYCVIEKKDISCNYGGSYWMKFSRSTSVEEWLISAYDMILFLKECRDILKQEEGKGK
jgi:hypothetical protein